MYILFTVRGRVYGQRTGKQFLLYFMFSVEDWKQNEAAQSALPLVKPYLLHTLGKMPLVRMVLSP